MLEREIEQKLRDCVRALGGLCLKLTCPGFVGVPDRLILMPGGILCFVELKRPGERERPIQRNVQARLRRLGFTVFSSVDGPERVDAVFTWLMHRMNEDMAQAGRAEWLDSGQQQEMLV